VLVMLVMLVLVLVLAMATVLALSVPPTRANTNHNDGKHDDPRRKNNTDGEVVPLLPTKSTPARHANRQRTRHR